MLLLLLCCFSWYEESGGWGEVSEEVAQCVGLNAQRSWEPDTAFVQKNWAK